MNYGGLTGHFGCVWKKRWFGCRDRRPKLNQVEQTNESDEYIINRAEIKKGKGNTRNYTSNNFKIDLKLNGKI